MAAMPARLLVALLRGYHRFIGPLLLDRVWLVPRCRFYPSCAVYAEQAVLAHGLMRGGWLALRRVGRCHPWNPGGYDPVPRRHRGTTRSLPTS